MESTPKDKFGNTLGHPIHPLFVHFPVGLLITSLVFDLIGGAAGTPMAIAAYYMLIAGLITAVLAIIAGVYDFVVRAVFAQRIRKIAYWHMGLNALGVALFFTSFMIRFAGAPYGPFQVTPIVFSAVGTVVLGFGAYLGGTMVYNHGLGVQLKRARRMGEPDAELRDRYLAGHIPTPSEGS